MDLIQIIVLSLLQGFTEFLPISSSAHLILPSQVLGWADQGLAFDVATHIGTLAAVILYFRRDIVSITQGWVTTGFSKQMDTNARLAWAIVIATIPAGLVGLFCGEWIESNFRSSEVIAYSTMGFGLLLLAADRIASEHKDIVQMTLTAALIIGIFQAFALIPGTSRSGITITAALFLGFQRQSAARFSFLISIPLILAAGLLKTKELIEQTTQVDWTEIGLAAFISAVSAYICIYFFLAMINRIGMMPFVVYRLILGAILLIWFV
ncbi:undecaprenyl-diphosphatase [Oleispira antarctica]|uniref:Undecaprenyl-diphosphatase n=1 Tax=Oleispira antarctica TaxID=188908 RepID=A0A1Y5HRE0_OLEAN|nr:undecaprenyl-diphosphatase [Oleispira antarctica]